MTNQSFPILYQNERFLVDPSSLYNSSQKFQELISLYGHEIQSKHLRQTYVQDAELKEICLIAKLFKAEQIYNTGLNFIKSNIDSNFFVPDNLFDEINGNQYLLLESVEKKPLIHHIDVNDLEFDDDVEPISHDSNKEKNVLNTNNTNNSVQKQPQAVHSVCYQIVEDIPLLKRSRFYFTKGNNVLYMAKAKKNSIYIGKGTNLHISETNIEDSAKITRKDEVCNIVNTDDQEFRINFVKFGESYSMNTAFINKGARHVWKPKDIISENELNGEYNRKPMPSKRNIILQNLKNKPTLIIRKMTNKEIEVECHPDVNPIIIFAISLSQIIGPATL